MKIIDKILGIFFVSFLVLLFLPVFIIVLFDKRMKNDMMNYDYYDSY
jgi:hypothetical protein